MSAPLAADVLRELGAEVRTFATVRGALLWYRDQLARRLQATRQGFEVGSGPCSREERDRKQTTANVIATCLAPVHRADGTLQSQALRRALPMNGERLLYLVEWYENTYGNGDDLARKWNPNADDPRWQFIRWCRVTELILRHRLATIGLLEDA